MKYQARKYHIINWPEYPLLRITVCFILGIILSDKLDTPINYNLNILFGIFIFFALTVAVFKTSKGVIKILSIAILCIGIFSGMLRCDLEKVKNQNYHFKHSQKTGNQLVGVVSSEVKKKKRYSATIDVHEINGVQCTGKLLLYFGIKDSIDYKQGNIISFSGKIYALRAKTNPHSFDYKSHLRYKGIGAQMFLKEHSHSLLGHSKLSLIEGSATGLRSWALKVFEHRFKDKDQLATASAMVLGYRGHLSDELYTSFSETGAVHVLAVSGLHVGIICMIFIVFFNQFKRDDWIFKMIKLSILLLVVWTYALVTGASPAVLRASVMFSLILIGRLWFKGANIYNILSFSALILLVINPYLLFQLSFQFSYLALISILFFQPKIERLYYTKHWLSSKIWQLTSVSIAAQILIFPISIFYFHKFPTYFILSGVAAVFLATFILGFGLLLLCFNAVPYIGDFIAFGYGKMLDFFLWIISCIHALPFNKVEGIYISGYAIMLLYLLIGSIMFLLSIRPISYRDIIHKKVKRKRLAKLISAICILLLLVNNLLFTYRNQNHKQLIVYDVSKSTIIDLFWNYKLYTLKSDHLDDTSANFTCEGNRIYHGSPEIFQLSEIMNNTNNGFVLDNNGGVLLKNTSLILLDKLDIFKPFISESDVLLVTNNAEVSPYEFLGLHSTALVILDNSLSFKVKNMWKNECIKRGIQIHDVRKNGVFILSK